MKKKKFELEVPGGADKVLLHTCCAPCSSAIIECLMQHGVRPTIYYCNPNIYPLEEYTIRKEEKFDGGIVTAHMNVEKGRIKEIKLFGDFFGNGDIAELEETLQGLPLDEHLEDNLQKIHIDECMKGIRVEELAALLRD